MNDKMIGGIVLDPKNIIEIQKVVHGSIIKFIIKPSFTTNAIISYIYNFINDIFADTFKENESKNWEIILRLNMATKKLAELYVDKVIEMSYPTPNIILISVEDKVYEEFCKNYKDFTMNISAITTGESCGGKPYLALDVCCEECKDEIGKKFVLAAAKVIRDCCQLNKGVCDTCYLKDTGCGEKDEVPYHWEIFDEE